MNLKNVVALVALLVSFTMMSQQTSERAVGDFNEIKVYDLIEVKLVKSDENKVIVKGDNVDDLQVVNRNGTLRVKMAINKKFHGENTFVEVYYKELDVIDANEGARITSDGIFAQNSITLKAQEGANIKVELDVRRVDSRAVTGGIIEASGVTKNLNVVLTTGGIFGGRLLKSEDANVKITAAGEAEVYASEIVDVHMRIGGDVLIYGNPKEVKQNTFAGGRVKVMD
ncbi:head GIN domain-containing protein [Arenibacter latericius]|uniref:head GIN domain-containing protein n=1 Tax=Arenibacter latericius TaxID=86104 RepID=UPI00042002C8|nr:head GIN domain-containing protein [Arenibacter latericius]MDX1365670.1 head GIN domain-containing protein [Arenibacter latericius]